MNVLDSSVVLAVLGDGAGAAEAQIFFDRALISSVNLAEVLQKAAQLGLDPDDVTAVLGELEIGTVPFDNAMAVSTAALWTLTKDKGLSLADRACLALAKAVSGIAVTADKAWADLDLPGVNIHLVKR